MEDVRIGVYICWCGSNIAKMIDVEKVASEAKKMPHVVMARDYKYMCSDPGQETLIEDIKKYGMNRVVVGACSPRIHEPTFRKALEKAGLNPYMFQMANIREQDSWVHIDREYATMKALSLIKAAVNRVHYHEPLDKRFVEVNPATLIIGGGISGISAALEIADAGKEVFLIERSDTLGGIASGLDQSFPFLESASRMVQDRIGKVMNHKKITVFFDASIETISGYVGNFQCRVHAGNKEKELLFGNIIVATGLKVFDPSSIPEYGYGKLPDVITSLELEEMLIKGCVTTHKGKEPEHIAIIHCVGSRNSKYHPYCSRVCCSTALKYANQLRSMLPGSNISELYADMRTFGKGCEEFYADTSRRNILFLMFDQENNLPVIKKAPENDKAGLIISMHEKLSDEEVEVPADLVVLMTGMEARDDAKEIARLTGVSLCGNEFFIEKHPKLDPVATTTDGVYIVGSCQSPKNIPESMDQAKAAAARVLASIAVGSMEVEVTTANVNEDICCGCQTCIMVCPYSAIHFDEEKHVSVVNESLCKGCGTCGSTCPTGAIKSKHFTDIQILSQIEGLLKTETEPI
jgi:heterodisulfide reductase subunit A